jgi:hypothetical protein
MSVFTDMVTANRHVSASIEILRSLLDKNLSKNEIIKQTSSDRSFVYDVIDTLKKGELVMEYKISKRERRRQKIHTQAKIMKITDLGAELIDILNCLEQYKKAYFELKKQKEEYFDKWIRQDDGIFAFAVNGRRKKPFNTVRDNVLREKGFEDQDLELYYDSYAGIKVVLDVLVVEVLEVVITRCALMLYRNKITSNNIVETILNSIFVNVVTFRVSIVIEGNMQYSSIKEDLNTKEQGGGAYINPYKDTIKQLLIEMLTEYHFPAMMRKEVTNAILAYLSLLKPPREIVENIYEMIKNNPEQLERDYPQLFNPMRLSASSNDKISLFKAYEAYMNKMMSDNKSPG